MAVGSALCQPAEDGGKITPLLLLAVIYSYLQLSAFAKQLSATERNYTTIEQECLAMVFSVKKYRHYLLMNPVVFFVDHMALCYLVNKPELSSRLARWVLLLSEFDYTV
jgi:uncharacterized membrane protein (GlpM family)